MEKELETKIHVKPPFLSERESQDHHPVRASPGHVWYVGRRRSALRICSQGTTSRGRNDPGPMSVKLCGLRSAVIRGMSPSWAWEGRLCMWERHESWGDRGQTVGATLQWPMPAAVMASVSPPRARVGCAAQSTGRARQGAVSETGRLTCSLGCHAQAPELAV